MEAKDLTEYCLSEAIARVGALEAENRRLREALERIRDQAEPQHPTGTWARDVARQALEREGVERG